MAIELTLSNGELLEFQPGLPSDYAGPILRGAVAFSTKTNLAELVLQELTGENYSIRFIIGKFLKRVNASGWIHTHGLYSYFMLKNGTRKKIDTIGKVHIRQDQYACFFTESTVCSATFEKTNSQLPESSASKVRVNMSDIVNFKFYNHAKKVYRKPDSGCHQETGKRHSCKRSMP